MPPPLVIGKGHGPASETMTKSSGKMAMSIGGKSHRFSGCPPKLDKIFDGSKKLSSQFFLR